MSFLLLFSYLAFEANVLTYAITDIVSFLGALKNKYYFLSSSIIALTFQMSKISDVVDLDPWSCFQNN